MLRDTITRHILRCHCCDAPRSSVAYDVFPDPKKDEFRSIQAAHAEEALKIYRKCEGDDPDVEVKAETISCLITALLNAAVLRDLDTIAIVQEALLDFALDGLENKHELATR